MNDKELYKQILGIKAPWEISKLQLNIEKGEINIHVNYSSKTGSCPVCNKECTIYDFTQERIWRHLDSCQLKTLIHSKQPRIKCPVHGVKTIAPPWAEPNSRFTLLFETLALKFLQNVKCQSRAAKLLRITSNELAYIKQKAVERGLSRRKLKPIKMLGIDEKSIENGHNYASIIYDLSESCVIDLCEGRDKISVKELVENIFTKEQREMVKCFTVDMWKAFITVIGEMFPNCEIVHDKFHIQSYLNDAVDKTRKSEHNKLLKEENNTLSRTKYLFLKNEENMTEKQKERFSAIKEADFQTSKVWALKETFKGFFLSKNLVEADDFFKNWCDEVEKLENKFLTKVCNMLKSHYHNIRTYITHRMTNALAESLNAKIQEIKTIARGFRGFKNFRTNVLFHLGKLDMSPQSFK